MTQGNCQYCGKEFKNKVVHERFCKSNPNKNTSVKNNSTEKEELGFVVAEPQKAKEHEHKKVESPFSIKNVEIYKYDSLVAWYEDGTYKEVIGTGIIESDGSNVPCALVMSSNGLILPPYMLPGFISMGGFDDNPIENTPEDDPDAWIDDPEVGEMPRVEKCQEPEPIISPKELKKEPDKKGILSFLSKKKTHDKKEVQPQTSVSKETLQLLQQLKTD